MSLTMIRTLLKASFFLFEIWNVLIFNRPQKVQMNFYFWLSCAGCFCAIFSRSMIILILRCLRVYTSKICCRATFSERKRNEVIQIVSTYTLELWSDWKSNPIQLLPKYGIVSRLYYAQLLGTIKIIYIIQHGTNCVRNETDLRSNLILPPNSAYFSFAVFHRCSEIMN